MEGMKSVLVTTVHRGVFFGYVAPDAPLDVQTIRISRARMCVYWSADVQGVLGLAATGPSKACKVGPPVPAITLQNVTSIIETTDDAGKRWETQPWSR